MSRIALVLPGQAYGPDLPLLWFARQLLAVHGFEIKILWTQAPGDVADAKAWVNQRAREGIADAGEVGVIVAKSLGTLALPAAAEHQIPGVWLTPLLQSADVQAALTALAAPTLLVGGTADGSWVSEIARRSSHATVEIEGGDHGLQIRDDPIASIASLDRAMRAVDEFLAGLS